MNAEVNPVEWIKIVISLVSLVGLLSILRLLTWVWDKIIIHNYPARLIQLHPINEQGSNVIIRKPLESSTLEEFLLKINFDLVTRFSVTITQIKICPNLRASCKFSSTKINGALLDESNPYTIKRGEAVKVRISKGITCNWGALDALYYLNDSNNEHFSGEVQIILYLSSEKWHGIKKIEVLGTLFPGGELKNLYYRYLRVVHNTK